MGCKRLNTDFFTFLEVVHSEKSAPEEKKRINYYPFGLKHKGYNNVVSSNGNSTAQKFKYNGKEEQDELGLNVYDFGWRNYDPAVGRWFNIDLLAEKHTELSPYNYVQNSPLIRFDPDGLTDYKLNKKTGDVTQIGDANDKPDRLFITRKGKLNKNKKTGEIKNKSIDVADGILEDGQNFKEDDNVIDVNGTNEDGSKQPTDEEVEDFALALSKEVGKEISGHGFGNKSGVSKLVLWKYKFNSIDGSENPQVYSRIRSETKTDIYGSSRIPDDIKASLNVIYHFHTHIVDKSNLWEDSNTSSDDDKAYRNKMNKSPFKKYLFYIKNSKGRKNYTDEK